MKPWVFPAILHKAGREDRAQCLDAMVGVLDVEKAFGASEMVPRGQIIVDEMEKGDVWARFKTVLALRQWESALESGAEWGLFMTDDLVLAPDFLQIAKAMVDGGKHQGVIGLLSNHPRGPLLFDEGKHAYTCNSWVVGPCYLLRRDLLQKFVEWYKALPDDEGERHRRWFNDDSAVNEWNTHHGPGVSWHPLPTIIEHGALESLVGHGDQYSRERLSWRRRRTIARRMPEEIRGGDDERFTRSSDWTWFDERVNSQENQWALLDAMKEPSFWATKAPMLEVGE